MGRTSGKEKKNILLRITADLLIALAAALLVSTAVVMQHRIGSVVMKEFYRRVFVWEMIMCTAFLLCAADMRTGFLSKFKAPGWILRILCAAVSLVLVFFGGKVALGCVADPDPSAEYAVVLGMALENGKPSKDLIGRVDRAGRYISENPDSILILTGGNPDRSGRTEAAVMKELLLERGVAEDRMLLEDKARSTKENFLNTAKIIDPSAPIVLISSNYHMDRAMKTAREAGFENILKAPAASDPGSFGANIMWEIYMEANEVISGMRH